MDVIKIFQSLGDFPQGEPESNVKGQAYKKGDVKMKPILKFKTEKYQCMQPGEMNAGVPDLLGTRILRTIWNFIWKRMMKYLKDTVH